MSLFDDRLKGLCAGLVVTAGVTTTASGFLVPDLELSVQVNGDAPILPAHGGTDLGGGAFNYSGELKEDPLFPDWIVTWDFNANLAESFASIGSGLTIDNLSNETLEFVILLTVPLDHAYSPQVQYGGSAGFTIVGTGGGEIATLGMGQSLWEAQLDGVEVGSLFDHPGGTGFTGSGSSSTSGNLTPGVFGPVLDSIGIQLNFSLTPDDSVTVTGIFGMSEIPGPSTMALLGLGAVIGRRRRRG